MNNSCAPCLGVISSSSSFSSLALFLRCLGMQTVLLSRSGLLANVRCPAQVDYCFTRLDVVRSQGEPDARRTGSPQ